jgi:YihY family inner membrane protein
VELGAVLDPIDRFQRQRPWLSVPVAIVKRYGESDVGNLAATLAYYGFFSLFPLLLVLSSIGGYVLQDQPDLQRQVLNSALAQFPIVGNQIQQNVGSIQGSGAAVLIGLALAIWAGLGGIRAAQHAMDTVWDVPRKRRPGTPKSVGLALLTLLVLAVFLVTAAFVAIVVGSSGGVANTVIKLILSVVLNVAFFALGYRVLTTADVTWRQVAPGAVLAGLGWTVLLGVGGWFVSSRISSSTHLYGQFAVVIGLLAWIYLGAQLALLGAVANVVVSNRLWPRSLRGEPTSADRLALRRSAEQEERRPDEDVDVTFEERRG